MRRVWLRYAVVVAVGGALLAGVLYLATTVDRRPPSVSDIRLTQIEGEDATRALTTTSVEIVFSELVEHASAEAAVTISPSVAGSYSWSGTTLVFTPADPLPLETEFVVEVDAGVTDEAGNVSPDAAPSFAFVTVGRPTVADSDPADGAGDVALDATITVRFSRLMDTASVENAVSLRPSAAYSLRWSGTDLELVLEQPLRASADYALVIGGDAADLAGITIGDPVTVGFRTVAGDLAPVQLIPADGSEGVAAGSSLVVAFDRAIDPDSVSAELLTISPHVAGSLEVAAPEGFAALADAEPRLLRFTPSGPLPPNTTFEVELGAGVRAVDGGQLALPVTWSFTTGAPAVTLGNQIVFISDRSGVANVWSMNPDGTNQRQVSAELSPVIDYAVAPDGRSLVVADGVRLVLVRADGTNRRVLTDEGVLEFDPSYSPDGRRIVHGRIDASGPRGLWERDGDGGGERRVELPAEIVPATPTPAATPEAPAADVLLRAPRFSPDGSALAFVDPAGRVAILELPAERLVTVGLDAAGPPVWLRDSSGVLVTGRAPSSASGEEAEVPAPPILPLDATTILAERGWSRTSVGIAFVGRSGGPPMLTALGGGAVRPAVDDAGRVAYVALASAADGSGGTLHLADSRRAAGDELPLDLDGFVTSVAFAPEAEVLLLAVADDEGRPAGVWVVRDDGRGAEERTPSGWLPRWLP